jgi:tetratricopeptide (TPR) repeat protein
MKLFSFLTISIPVLFCTSLSAQTNEGLDALNTGMYKTAISYFKKQITDPQVNIDTYYYLGETYRLSGKNDSAAFYYEMGLKEPATSALCMAGKAGLIMATNRDQAESLLKKATSIKEYKKKPSLYVAIAKAYAANKQTDKALENLNIAVGYDKKYTDIYLTEGDISLEKKVPDIGTAAQKYESAIYFDPTCKPAFIKMARIYYLAKKFDLSLDYLNKLKAIDDQFPPYLKLYGDICYEQGKYADAVAAYARYLQSPESGLADQIRHAYSLFFNKDYQQAGEQIDKTLLQDPGNKILNRLQAYNAYEVGDYSKGLEEMQEFFSKVDPADMITSDYKYYARLLAKNDQDSLSIVYYLKAAESSTDPKEFYKEIATSYEKMKKYREAASFLQKHVKSSDSPANSDIFLWGRDCYFAAGAIDSVAIAADPGEANVRQKLYATADSLFAEVTTRSPDNYLGYFWRARVNAIIDPETVQGLAKPYYEQTIALLEQSDKNNKRELVESYQYLGYYYYLKNDFENSKIYWNKILTIDPSNAVAQQAIEGLK